MIIIGITFGIFSIILFFSALKDINNLLKFIINFKKKEVKLKNIKSEEVIGETVNYNVWIPEYSYVDSDGEEKLINSNVSFRFKKNIPNNTIMYFDDNHKILFPVRGFMKRSFAILFVLIIFLVLARGLLL